MGGRRSGLCRSSLLVKGVETGINADKLQKANIARKTVISVDLTDRFFLEFMAKAIFCGY